MSEPVDQDAIRRERPWSWRVGAYALHIEAAWYVVA
jgi:hypothetical protein